MNNYTKTMIHWMARKTGIVLNDRYMEILNFTHNYYKKNKVGPLYGNLKRHLNVTKDEINSMFPYGLNSVYTWVGIPIHTPEKLCNVKADIKVDNYRELYLDHNATTYLRPEVAQVLNNYNSGKRGFANPSSATLQGKDAFDLINNSRKRIAQILDVRPEEVIFTGSGSEANNLVIKGIAFSHLKDKGHIITTKIEHPSVLNPVKWLESLGFTLSILDVQKDGILSVDTLKNALQEDTVLVSVMAVNNEIGIINPIKEIGAVLKERNIPFVVDAIQGFGKLDLKPAKWGVSALTFSGHKIYGPKGVGGLYLSQDVLLEPIIHGGGQEFGLRSGTENVGYIVALSEASRLASRERVGEYKRLLELRNYFLDRLFEIEPGIVVNGSLEKRSPWNLSIGFPGMDSGAVLLSLNSIGICASAGSACSAGKIKNSHVLEAIGADTENYGTIRFSFGLKTTKDGLDYFFKYLPRILSELKDKKA